MIIRKLAIIRSVILLHGTSFAASNGKAKDLISSGAVALDGEKVTELRMSKADLEGKILKVGKH